jgi:hypothetical protein
MTHTQQKDATVEAVALAIYEREVVTGQPTWDGLDYGRKGYHIKTAQAAISAFKESEEWKNREGLIRSLLIGVDKALELLEPFERYGWLGELALGSLRDGKNQAKQMGFGE